MLDWLLNAQYALTALVALNVVLAGRNALAGAGKGSELLIALALLGVCGGVAAVGWWLRTQGSTRGALLVLAGFWGLVVISVIVAAGRARWN